MSDDENFKEFKKKLTADTAAQIQDLIRNKERWIDSCVQASGLTIEEFFSIYELVELSPVMTLKEDFESYSIERWKYSASTTCQFVLKTQTQILE